MRIWDTDRNWSDNTIRVSELSRRIKEKKRNLTAEFAEALSSLNRMRADQSRGGCQGHGLLRCLVTVGGYLLVRVGDHGMFREPSGICPMVKRGRESRLDSAIGETHVVANKLLRIAGPVLPAPVFESWS